LYYFNPYNQILGCGIYIPASNTDLKYLFDAISAFSTFGLLIIAVLSLGYVVKQISQSNSLKCLELIQKHFAEGVQQIRMQGNNISHDWSDWCKAYLLIKSAFDLKDRLQHEHMDLFKVELEKLSYDLGRIFDDVPAAGFFFFLEETKGMGGKEAKQYFDKKVNPIQGWSGPYPKEKADFLKYRKESFEQLDFLLRITLITWRGYNLDNIMKVNKDEILYVLGPIYPYVIEYYDLVS